MTPLPWMGGSQPSNERSSRRRRRRIPGFEETVKKRLNMGYYWPTMEDDTARFVQKLA